MKRIADKSVDLVITDPPFGCTDCKWDKKIDLLAFHQELKRNRKEICDYAYPKNLLDYYEPQKDNKKHPCQKPLELVKYLLKTYSNEEMLILDPFAGSGVTGVACKECNRNFIGFELNKEYYEKAIERKKGLD